MIGIRQLWPNCAEWNLSFGASDAGHVVFRVDGRVELLKRVARLAHDPLQVGLCAENGLTQQHLLTNRTPTRVVRKRLNVLALQRKRLHGLVVRLQHWNRCNLAGSVRVTLQLRTIWAFLKTQLLLKLSCCLKLDRKTPTQFFESRIRWPS